VFDPLSEQATCADTSMTDALSWLQEFTTAAGGSVLTDDERESILALAGVAAHSSERTAAPLTCWVAAAAGLSPVVALEIAQSLAERQGQDEHGPIE
jgi:hypothetical protein